MAKPETCNSIQSSKSTLVVHPLEHMLCPFQSYDFVFFKFHTLQQLLKIYFRVRKIKGTQGQKGAAGCPAVTGTAGGTNSSPSPALEAPLASLTFNAYDDIWSVDVPSFSCW